MPPRAKLKAPAAAAPASGAALEHLPEILRALLSAENESRGVAEATLKALVAAGFGAAGQRCMAISRVVLVGGAKDLVPRLAEMAGGLKVGP